MTDVLYLPRRGEFNGAKAYTGVTDNVLWEARDFIGLLWPGEKGQKNVAHCERDCQFSNAYPVLYPEEALPTSLFVCPEHKVGARHRKRRGHVTLRSVHRDHPDKF